jgi:hypothetical protein
MGERKLLTMCSEKFLSNLNVNYLMQYSLYESVVFTVHTCM